MSCYFRHIGDLFEEAGVEVTKDNRAALRACLSQVVGDADGDCPTAWKLVKEWKADPARRKRLIRALKAFRPQPEDPPRDASGVAGLARQLPGRISAGARGARQKASELLESVFDWATQLDPASVKASVGALRRRKPYATPRQLAEAIVRSTRLKTVTVGVGTGLPANPFISAAAGLLDAGTVLRFHAAMVAQIGECYDPGFVDDPAAQAEILVPLFGVNAISQAGRETAMLGGVGATREGIRRALTGSRRRAFRKWVLRYFGEMVTERTVASKVIPIIGAAIGGGWNFAETSAVGKRAIRYFEEEPVTE
ncbi:MAG: hypothetical protein FJX75_10320 [Armatimonadetes bacterium]|nr:hypothetical protein [Armatimonadota bacterium]